MELVRWEPFEGLNRLHNHINDLFDQRVSRARALPAVAPGVWLPPVDIVESKDAYLIRAELPGMKKNDFNLEVNEGTLTLSGERKPEALTNGLEYRRSERVNGKFSRSFYLPRTVKQDGIKASYQDGIIEIQVPKAEEAKPKQIAINVH